MSTKNKKDAVPGRPRAPAGKKQVLAIMDQNLIRDMKMAALEDDRKMSHVFEEAAKEWLAKRKARKGTGSK